MATLEKAIAIAAAAHAGQVDKAGQPYILDVYTQSPGVFPGAWGPVQTSVAPASIFQFSDTALPAPSSRLYRVRQFFP